MEYEPLSNSYDSLGQEFFNQYWQGQVVTQSQSEQHLCEEQREKRSW